MKSVALIAMSLGIFGASAQDKGRFEVYDFDNFKLHVYYTNDVMGDASYIVEGDRSLVAMEYPLFKENVAEFDAYLSRMDKPVEQIITDYHVGGSGDYPQAMAKGMPAFVKGPIYGGMMENFKRIFGKAMAELPTGESEEISFGSTRTWAGVTFKFSEGASSDFPAASILIGGKAYYTHWAPAKAHANRLQVSSPEAIDAELAEAERALASGAELFIGGHGGATNVDDLKFKIDYLKRMKQSLKENTTVDTFVNAMKKAYPGLSGEEGLGTLAEALYKQK